MTFDMKPNRELIENAWAGRISGCLLGKPIEYLCQQRGNEALYRYLEAADALPLREYVPLVPVDPPIHISEGSTLGNIDRAGPDDDINYTVLSLLMLERYGPSLTTGDVGYTWLTTLPAASLWTAEREAYRCLLRLAGDDFEQLTNLRFADLAECSANPYNHWIGAQIRTDLYGWVNPGRPDRASALARADAELSHRGSAVEAAAFIAALGAAIPALNTVDEAVSAALDFVDGDSSAAAAVRLALEAAPLDGDVGLAQLRHRYEAEPAVGSPNNLALVVWALLRSEHDFSAAIGDAVAAGWDTDCNGATVGGLWGLTGGEIPHHWTDPWAGRVIVDIAGTSELAFTDLVDRTFAIAVSLTEN